MSSEGETISGTGECTWWEERSQKQLSVLRGGNSLVKVLDLSRLREDARTFISGPQWPASTSRLLLVQDAFDEAGHVS